MPHWLPQSRQPPRNAPRSRARYATDLSSIFHATRQSATTCRNRPRVYAYAILIAPIQRAVSSSGRAPALDEAVASAGLACVSTGSLPSAKRPDRLHVALAAIRRLTNPFLMSRLAASADRKPRDVRPGVVGVRSAFCIRAHFGTAQKGRRLRESRLSVLECPSRLRLALVRPNRSSSTNTRSAGLFFDFRHVMRSFVELDLP